MGRNHNIDVMRGVAISLVFLCHFAIFFKPEGVAAFRILHAISQNGFYGVTSFFVISGFLITTTMIRRFGALDKVKFSDFYWMRFCRIGPPLLIVLICLVALAHSGISLFAPSVHGLWLPVAAALSFTFNVLRSVYGGVGAQWDPLWSLSVEEMFYLLFPLLCLGLRDKLVPCLVVVVIYGVVYRLLYGSITDNAACFDCLSLGCLTAIYVANRPANVRVGKRVSVLLLIVGTAIFWATYFAPMNIVFGPTLIAIGSALTLVAITLPTRGTAPKLWSFVTMPIQIIGRFSYEIYLIHMSVLISVLAAVQSEWIMPVIWLELLLSVMLTVMLSFGMGYFISEPANKYLRRMLTTVRAHRGQEAVHGFKLYDVSTSALDADRDTCVKRQLPGNFAQRH